MGSGASRPSALEPAVVYVNPGPTAQRQQRAIVDWCTAHGYWVRAMCTEVCACEQAVRAGIARVVVAATDPRNGLRSRVAAAGGRVELVRANDRPPTLADLLRRAVTRRSPHDIAHGLDMDTTDVSNIIRRLGLDRQSGRHE
jgi:hypothetical protein